ncbi:MAG: hypothetical protein IJN52_06760 [Bacteroidales bacterium]|nr:hypothetical protein [Bacteroidales bacterium]
MNDDTTLSNYSYLADCTKLEAVDGSDGGLVYRGPFVYRKSPGGSSLTLESVAFGKNHPCEWLRRNICVRMLGIP